MAFAVLVIAVFLLYFATGVFKGSAGTHNVAVQITDPPNVPAGTQQLIVSYSSVQVHVLGSTQSGWVSASGSGSLNLLALTNVSQTIANAEVRENATVNLVRFNVTSAKIVINGATYNVSTPNSQVTVAVTGSEKINSSSAVLIDFYPTVTGHANVYILVPAARAIVVSSNSTVSINTNVGSTAAVSAGVRVRL